MEEAWYRMEQYIVEGKGFLKSCYDWYPAGVPSVLIGEGTITPSKSKCSKTTMKVDRDTMNVSVTVTQIEVIAIAEESSPALSKSDSSSPSTTSPSPLSPSPLLRGKFLEEAFDEESGLKCIVIQDLQPTNMIQINESNSRCVMKNGDILISVNERIVIYEDIENVIDHIRMIKAKNEPWRLRFLNTSICSLHIYIDKMSLHNSSHKDIYGFVQSTWYIRMEKEITKKSCEVRSQRDLEWVGYLKVILF